MNLDLEITILDLEQKILSKKYTNHKNEVSPLFRCTRKIIVIQAKDHTNL